MRAIIKSGSIIPTECFNARKALLLAGAAACVFMVPGTAFAQNAMEDEVIVTGTRQTIQDAIALKRQATQIVDGLSASEIGDLPALSIGEALESITGAASHRENGGATEISIRGLGPFLSSTTFNGREATNGGGDRSVNFSQFPSELMSKLEIFKTQDASLIEGGVAGQINLGTLRPLDYNKRRMQFGLKGNVNPDQLNQKDATKGDIGYRGTLSFVDQFEVQGLGDIGISIGGQLSDTSQPEAESRSSSPSGTSHFACIIDPSNTDRGYGLVNAGDCEDSRSNNIPGYPSNLSEDNLGYVTYIDPATGLAVDNGTPYAFAPSSRGYRQNDTSEEREALFGAVQWQPNDRWDVNFDIEWSNRDQSERRHDLNFANQKRVTPGVTLDALQVSPLGAVLNWEGDTAIESNSELYTRTEEYIGGGLAASYELNDRLTATIDASFSKTRRDEIQISLRTQSDNDDIFNVDTAAGYRPNVQWDRLDSEIPQFTITDFDVTDHTLFSDEYRVRVDTDVDRENENKALRLDFNQETDWKAIKSVDFGARIAEQTYVNYSGVRYTGATIDDSSQAERDAIVEMNQRCRNDQFPEDNFLSSVRNGDLITTVDSGGAVISSGNSWATFDTMCITNAIFAYNGDTFEYPEVADDPSTDVTETTFAGYVKANYETSWADKAVRGNIGVRVVKTDVESKSFRTDYNIVDDGSGNLSLVDTGNRVPVVGGGDYTVVLPSFTANMDLRDDVILRAGIFRGMSRADPADLGFSRSFSVNNDDDITDVDELIAGVNASGNPNTEPLTSWNLDGAVEWYPNADTIVAVGAYYKRFKGGFEFSTQDETYVIDGQSLTVPVVLTQTNQDTSNLKGIELTASTRFSKLPGALSGLGAKVSYNYADSDFEFQDSFYGDRGYRDENGQFIQTHAGILAPGNIPGFSKHVFSGQVYYQIGDLDLAGIYKYRSEYFQPYTSNGTRLRYIGNVGVFEARASYQLNKNFKFTVEAINLFDEPKKSYYFSTDNLGEVNVYGPRIFAGVRAKF